MQTRHSHLFSNCFLLLAAVALLWAAPLSAGTSFNHTNADLLAPSLSGPTGGFRLISAQRPYGGELGFQFGFHGEYFQLNDFFATGDNTKRLAGTFNLNIAFCEFSEVFFTWRGFSSLDNNNTDLIQQYADFDTGTKIGVDFGGIYSLAAFFQAEYRNGVGDLNLNSKAWNFMPKLLFTTDFSRSPNPMPLRIHYNIGYRIDNSLDLAGGTTLTNEQRFYLGVWPKDQLVAGIGFEVPVDFVTVSAEYTTEQALGTGGGRFEENPQRFTVGMRIYPTSNRQVTFDAAGDIGIFNGTPNNMPIAQADWNLIFGFTYSMLPEAAAPPPAPTTGTISGTVTDSVSGQPIGGATLVLPEMQNMRLLTDPETGAFRIDNITAGTVIVEVQKEGYETAKGEVAVKAGADNSAAFSLNKMAIPKEKGILFVKITDADLKPLSGNLIFKNMAKPTRFVIPQSGLRAKLDAGTYTLVVNAKGYLAEEHVIEVESDTKVVAEYKLREKSARVALVKKKIIIRDTIQFNLGKWTISTASLGTLNRVADLIEDNPQISRLRIEGHTDSTGRESYNLYLSQKRAEAVLEYLVTRGITRQRLEAVGYGPSRPIADNATRQGRALNRRVEFTVIRETPPAGAPSAAGGTR